MIAPACTTLLTCALWASPVDVDFDRVIDRARECVVRLYGLGAGLSAGYGSGILVSDDGLVVTVMSLLLDSEQLRAVVPDGTPYRAEIIKTDERRHLALLKLVPMHGYDRRGRRVEGGPVGPGTFPYLAPADSTKLEPGDWIIAAGNPFKVAQGKEPVSISVGTFSTRTRDCSSS